MTPGAALAQGRRSRRCSRLQWAGAVVAVNSVDQGAREPGRVGVEREVPRPSKISSRLPGMASWAPWACRTGTTLSRSPHSSIVGMPSVR
ncbi:hypothetical protein ACRAWF_06405 [Streptomyces sp. L7]